LDNFRISSTKICDNVRFTHIYKQIIFEWYRAYSFCEYTISDLQVFDKVGFSVWIKSDLELASGMFFLVFFFASGDNEVIDDFSACIVTTVSVIKCSTAR